MSSLMTKSFQRPKGGEAGFSLMELIVAIGIIVAIAAVTIPLVTRFAGTGATGAQTAELENVQTAVDSLVAEASISSVDARTGPSTATQVWTSLPTSGGAAIQVGGSNVDLADYMRMTSDQTTYFYCWGVNGAVTQFANSSTVCP